MDKRKCTHCGYKFKPKDENDTICDLCKIQLRDDSGPKREFDVKSLGSTEVEGKLCLLPERVVFEPNEVYFKDKRLEIAVSKIKDVRFATEKDISALRVFLLGATLGVFFKKKQRMLTIDYEDEFEIIQHPIFEGADMEIAIRELNEIRKIGKIESHKA
jgi:hypothetical protein